MNQDFIIVMFLLFFLFCKKNSNESFTEITEEESNQLFANYNCQEDGIKSGDACKYCDAGKTFGTRSDGKTSKCGCHKGLCVNRDKISL